MFFFFNEGPRFSTVLFLYILFTLCFFIIQYHGISVKSSVKVFSTSNAHMHTHPTHFFFSSHPTPKHTQILNLWVRFDAQLKFMTFKRVLVILTSKHILSQLSGVPFNTKPRRIMFLSPSRMITCFKVFLKRREIIWRRPVSSLSVVREKSVCCSKRTVPNWKNHVISVWASQMGSFKF